MFDLPDPVSMYESAKNAGLAREVADTFVSAMLSAAITGAWVSGSSKWATWTGEGQALKDAATAAYLTLEREMKVGFLTLTVPQEMLSANNLARFQSQKMEKK